MLGHPEGYLLQKKKRNSKEILGGTFWQAQGILKKSWGVSFAKHNSHEILRGAPFQNRKKSKEHLRVLYSTSRRRLNFGFYNLMFHIKQRSYEFPTLKCKNFLGLGLGEARVWDFRSRGRAWKSKVWDVEVRAGVWKVRVCCILWLGTGFGKLGLWIGIPKGYFLQNKRFLRKS